MRYFSSTTAIIRTIAPAGALLLAGLAIGACTRAEDPAVAEFRTRLTQEAQLSPAELKQLRDTVNKAIAGRRVRIARDGVATEMDVSQRTTVLGVLAGPAGLFDEGLRQEDGETFRLLNAPGDSDDSEIEASRRLWIDTTTFEPRRFLFSYAFPGRGDYEYDLDVE